MLTQNRIVRFAGGVAIVMAVAYCCYHFHRILEDGAARAPATALQIVLHQQQQADEFRARLADVMKSDVLPRQEALNSAVVHVDAAVAEMRAAVAAVCQDVPLGVSHANDSLPVDEVAERPSRAQETRSRGAAAPASGLPPSSPDDPSTKQRMRGPRVDAMGIALQRAHGVWNAALDELADPVAGRERSPSRLRDQALQWSWTRASDIVRPLGVPTPYEAAWGSTSPLPNLSDTRLLEFCLAAAGDPMLSNGPGRLPVGTETFGAEIARVNAEKARHDAQRAALEQSIASLDKELSGAQGTIEKTTNQVVVSQLPFSMLLILGFGVVLLGAARYLDNGWDSGLAHMLIESGQLLQFATVVILFALVLVLSLADAIEADHTATLLASVGGYLLGKGIGRQESGPPAVARLRSQQVQAPPERTRGDLASDNEDAKTGQQVDATPRGS